MTEKEKRRLLRNLQELGVFDAGCDCEACQHSKEIILESVEKLLKARDAKWRESLELMAYWSKQNIRDYMASNRQNNRLIEINPEQVYSAIQEAFEQIVKKYGLDKADSDIPKKKG